MNKTMETITKSAIAAGLVLGIGSCTVDVATCPGEVETGTKEAPALTCDENPENDDLLNNPGTTEQKLMYGGFAVAAAATTVLFVASRREETSHVTRLNTYE